jgi:hypothetical protein
MHAGRDPQDMSDDVATRRSKHRERTFRTQRALAAQCNDRGHQCERAGLEAPRAYNVRLKVRNVPLKVR